MPGTSTPSTRRGGACFDLCWFQQLIGRLAQRRARADASHWATLSGSSGKSMRFITRFRFFNKQFIFSIVGQEANFDELGQQFD